MEEARRQEDQGRDRGGDSHGGSGRGIPCGMMNPPSHNPQVAWSGLQGVAPATHSPTMSPWGYMYSRGYSDSDVHGGFNPNTTFPHGTPQRSFPTGFGHDPRTPSPAFSVNLNTEYSYSPSTYSSAASRAPSLRRGILPFAPSSSLQFNYANAADMDEIIMSGSVAAASHPEFGAQDETMDTTGDIDDELDDVEEEEGGGRGGGGGTRTSAVEEGEEEKAGSERQAGRTPRQVDVQGRRVPCRSVEDCQHRPDRPHESEHRYILGENQNTVQRTQAGRPRLR
ncbi:putative methionyl-tRNA synthetase [Hordeum vulgare]|nr:putative methionyl-tRNA synthetase [Hordeum vulgare]